MGQWNVAGHSERVIRVGSPELETFATDCTTNPGPTRSRPASRRFTLASLLSVLRRIERSSRHDWRAWQTTSSRGAGWDETNAVRNGTIRRKTRFAAHIDQAILSGPHYYVGNPLSKTPRRSCSKYRPTTTF